MLEPDSPRHIRVKQLFLWARQIVRARGICSLQGIEANIGALTIHLSALGPHSEGARKQGSAPRLPYRLDIWRRKKMVLSVDYDAGRQIEGAREVFEEAGGKCSDMKGNPASVRGPHVLTDNGAIHEQMLAVFGDIFEGRYRFKMPELPVAT